MAEIDFPASPTLGEEYVFGGTAWTWTGYSWDLKSSSSPLDPSSIAYTHIQAAPSTTWTINHYLGYPPGGISVKDTAGTIVEGDVHYTSLDSLYIVFQSAFSGVAYLS